MQCTVGVYFSEGLTVLPDKLRQGDMETTKQKQRNRR